MIVATRMFGAVRRRAGLRAQSRKIHRKSLP
jgi:hypothetical protein